MKEVVEAAPDVFDSTSASPVVIVPDDVLKIQAAINSFIAAPDCPDLILTSGGTGYSPTDCTPQALEPLLSLRADSLSLYLQTEALKITPMACLSRGLIGILHNKKTMVVALPGKPKAVKENMEILLRNRILPHALQQMKGKEGH